MIFLVLVYTRVICAGRLISEGTLNITIFGSQGDCAAEVEKYKRVHPFRGFSLDVIRCSDESYISGDENAIPQVIGGGEERDEDWDDGCKSIAVGVRLSSR